MKFVITLVEGDKIILSTESAVSFPQYEEITSAFARWKETERGTLILAEAVVHDRRQVTVELELDVLPSVSAAEARHEHLLEYPFDDARVRQLGGTAGNRPPPPPPSDRG